MLGQMGQCDVKFAVDCKNRNDYFQAEGKYNEQQGTDDRCHHKRE